MSNKPKISTKDFSGGFTTINYKGIPVKHDYIVNGLEGLGDIVDDATNTMYFNHFRRSTYPGTSKGKHACLQMDYWCWTNALRYPQDIPKYLRKHHAN